MKTLRFEYTLTSHMEFMTKKSKTELEYDDFIEAELEYDDDGIYYGE